MPRGPGVTAKSQPDASSRATANRAQIDYITKVTTGQWHNRARQSHMTGSYDSHVHGRIGVHNITGRGCAVDKNPRRSAGFVSANYMQALRLGR